MDYHSLVACNLPRPRATMNARAEAQYYREHAAIPRPRLAPLVSVAAATLILLLVGVA